MGNENAEAGSEGRTIKTVNGKTLSEGPSKGGITFIRPKELAANGTTGVVAEGIYEGTVPNNFDDAKADYKVRKDNGDLVILNSAGSLIVFCHQLNIGFNFISVVQNLIVGFGK
jgi:hypothetical protein